MPQHDCVSVDPIRLAGDPLEHDGATAPRELDRGPGTIDRAGCLEHEVETRLWLLISPHVPGFGRPQLEAECEA